MLEREENMAVDAIRLAYGSLHYSEISLMETFEQILSALQINRWTLGEPLEKQRLIRLTCSQVRSIIGKWQPSKANPMKIGEVVEDIIDKVSRQDNGVYTYKYRRGKDKEHLYELVINEHESFFHDVINKRFYLFDIDSIAQNTKMEK